jgi:hypothetical protein
MKTHSIAIAVLSTFLIAAASAHAQPIAISSTDLNNFLVVYNPSGPSLDYQGLLTGGVSTFGIFSLDYGPGGELYAYMDDPDSPTVNGGVYQIDLATGTGTPAFIGGVGALAGESEVAVSGSGLIATSPANSVNFLQVFDPSGPSVIYSATLTGTVAAMGIFDLDFGPNGELYAYMDDPDAPTPNGGVYEIDLATGTGSPAFIGGIGALAGESELAVSSAGLMATSAADSVNYLQVFDPNGPGLLFDGFLTGAVGGFGIFDLAFGPGGELFAYMDDPDGPTGNGGVYQIDLATGTGSLVFQRGGIAGESEIAISPVPEPGPCVLLGSGLLAVAVLARVRRNRRR